MSLWARHGRSVAWVVAVVASLPQVMTGFFHDDLLQHLGLEGAIPGYQVEPHMLYEFTGIESTQGLIRMGAAPWFTHPEFSMRFFRPLSSVIIAGEHALFGRAPLPPHLVGLAWFLVLVGLALAIFRRLLTPARAGLASVIFAAAGGHTMNIAWVATRHSLVGATLGALAVWLHVARRGPASEWRPPAWAAPAVLVITMFASETSLAAVTFIVAFELVGRDGSWRERALGAAPAGGLGLVYVVAYGAAHYGVAHSGLYISPFRHPLAFAAAAGARVPILVAEMVGAVPSDLWSAAPPLRPVLFGVGIVGAAALTALLVRSGLSPAERRQLTWLAIAAVVSVLPVVGGVIGGRLLTLPSLGAAAIVATAVDVTLARARSRRTVVAWSPVVILMALHLGLAPVSRVGLSFALHDLSHKMRRVALDAELSECPEGGAALLLSGSDPTLSLYAVTALAYYTPDAYNRFGGSRVLSMAAHEQRVERLAEREIRLFVHGERAANNFEVLFRDTPLSVGDAVDTGLVSAHVEGVQNGFPTQVRFVVPADSCLWVWRDGALHGAPLPPLGAVSTIPYEPGPMGL